VFIKVYAHRLSRHDGNGKFLGNDYNNNTKTGSISRGGVFAMSRKTA
jgi:hypothetical protein